MFGRLNLYPLGKIIKSFTIELSIFLMQQLQIFDKKILNLLSNNCRDDKIIGVWGLK